MYKYSFTPSGQAGELLPVLDPNTVPKFLRHQTKVCGNFNDEVFELNGGGKGNPHQGTLDCKMASAYGPVSFPMSLMNVIIIFGYPTYSKHINVFDIFKRSNGYEYERHIEFESGGSMDSLHIVRYGENENERFLNGNFSVEIKGQVPDDIVSLSPILETFVPAGKGKVRSQFILAWNRKSGGQFLANCESEYRLRHDLELPQVLFRHAEFVKDNSTRKNVDLDEKIWVTNQLRNIEQAIAA